MRYAHGQIDGGKIVFSTIDQVPNVPKGRFWDLDLILGFCRRAAAYAATHGASVGIDSWGVDHAFVTKDGRVEFGPVLYRDPTHSRKADELVPVRHRLFELTGIAHQPFNTFYQLAARLEEDPGLLRRCDWFVMPDLIGFLLTGVRRYERTQASTTQLMGLDGQWSTEAFELLGAAPPSLQPVACGDIVGQAEGAPLVSVASHDTASAVLGVGELAEGDAYLNVGTWALLGVVLDRPETGHGAESGGWTNEWAHDGRIRFLKNIPGFYVLNRVHDELGVRESIGDWLDSRDRSFTGRFDPQHPTLYSPESMPEACAALLDKVPQTEAEWAQAALGSLVDCIASDVPRLARASGRTVRRLRVVGGGSRSEAFCQALADATGLGVVSGPDEATVLGNLALQFAAMGHVPFDGIGPLITQSVETRDFQPQGGTCASS